MNENDIRQAFEPFKHPYWQVVGLYKANGEDKDTFTCDNYFEFNAFYQRILNSYGFKLSDKETGAFINFYAACEVTPGLFARFPTRKQDDIPEDEIYGAAFFSEFFANRICDYSSNNHGCFWLTNPGHWHWNYFYARFPSFLTFIKVCAGRSIWFSQFYGTIGIICSALTSHGETTGKLQTWLMIPKMRNKLVLKLAIFVWRVIMKLRYPGGVKDLMYIYFKGNNNPFYLCAKDDFN